jgi:hypothetical protein
MFGKIVVVEPQGVFRLGGRVDALSIGSDFRTAGIATDAGKRARAARPQVEAWIDPHVLQSLGP